jgi:hypothetical protein
MEDDDCGRGLAVRRRRAASGRTAIFLFLSVVRAIRGLHRVDTTSMPANVKPPEQESARAGFA